MKARICRAISSPTPTRPTGKAGRRPGEHIAAGGFRHRSADRRVDDPGRDGIDAHRRKFERETARKRLQRAVGGADNGGVGPRANAQITGHQRERSTGTDLGSTCDAPGAPELAFHGRAHVFHGYGLERSGAELRGGDHDMIDRTATAEQTGDTFIAGDIRRDRLYPQPFCNRIRDDPRYGRR